LGRFSPAWMSKCLVVFDFDCSLLDTNSDTFIFEKLSTQVYGQIDLLYGQMQWTDLMNHLVGMLYELGFTRQQLTDVLSKAPIHDSMIKALDVVVERGGDLIILSDANVEYINIILNAYGIRDYFKLIVTNPSHWDGERLVIERFVPRNEVHGCLTETNYGVSCPENICKGIVLEKYLNETDVTYDKIIYIGDSTNDFCPATKLSSNDLLLVRSGYRLERWLNEHDVNINPKVMKWKDGNDILKIFKSEIGNDK